MNSQFINNNMREQTVNNQPQLLHQQPKANNSIQLLNNASQPQLRESNVYQNQLIQTHQPQLIVWHQQPLNTCHQQQKLNTCHRDFLFFYHFSLFNSLIFHFYFFCKPLSLINNRFYS